VSVIDVIFAANFEWVVVGTNAVAVWILFSLMIDWYDKTSNKRDRIAAMFRQTPSYYGMLLGHAGIAMATIGIAVTVYFSEEKDVRLEAGQSLSLAGYEYTLVKMNKVQGPNYVADQGEIRVTRNNETVTTLYPEKRLYKASGSVMTEAAMDAGFFRDLYVALGEPVDTNAWAVRVHYKPFVRWIWLGGLLVSLGGFLTVADRRYRAVRQRTSVPAMSAAA
jgi:cytochrome c-type biogenesis protein CcmF